MSWLVVSLGSRPVLAMPVDRSPLSLGRSARNDVVLPLPEVADEHATLHLTDQGAILEAAQGETLMLDGHPVTRARLSSNQSVGVGGYRLRFVDGEKGSVVLAESGPHSTETHTIDESASWPHDGPIRVVRVVTGKDAGLTATLDSSPFIIGRAPDCGMVLHDETVSWRHLALEQAEDGLKVRDLGSRNGTFLQGQRVESAFARAGSRVRTGRTTLELSAGADRSKDGEETPRAMAELVGQSDRMQKVYEMIRKAAASRVAVLLQGETGTGKDLAARAIHAIGPRNRGPYVSLNCSAIPHDMLEDELFGHVRGAFTNASSDRQGAFAAAHEGTIFLDEVAELPLALQPKLLRVLEDGRVPKVGGGGALSDFRVITATNRDLAREVEEGRFRRDLYFRLAVLEVKMPPLADRIEDLADLVHHFLRVAEESTGVPGSGSTRFAEDAMALLRSHPWPGNVRELRNIIHGAVVRRPGGVVDHELVEQMLARSPAVEGGPRGPQTLLASKIETVLHALEDCGWNKMAAARRLGISASTLHELIRKHELEKRRKPPAG